MEPIPIRMVNEFVYCPRLFYYEHVEGIFVHNHATIEGSQQHRRVDEKEDDLPPPEELAETDRPVRARSVMLASERHAIVARMDLLEIDNGVVTPVDYKRGKPNIAADGGIDAWDTDRVQLALQAVILREHGYTCREAIVYYRTTKQRVRFIVDDALIAWALQQLAASRCVARGDRIPPPLVDSPKCPGCSLVGVCLPDETRQSARVPAAIPHGETSSFVQQTLFDADLPRTARLAPDREPDEPIRRIIAARDDLRPLYLNTQGLTIGKSGHVLTVKEKKKVIQKVRINEICQVNVMGNIQLTTQAIQTLCQAEVPICYFSMGGWFYGVTQGLGVKNIFLRREQFRLADVPAFCLRLARALVAGKIRNSRTLLQRNHVEPPRDALVLLKSLQQEAERATAIEQLLGIEGHAARVYFQNFAGMIKAGTSDDPFTDDAAAEEPSATPHADAADGNAADTNAADRDLPGTQASPPNAPQPGPPPFTFDFNGRNRRPPKDPVNALLSLGYSLLTKDFTVITQTVGFDPYLGFFHQPRFGRASLALDLMEPFRPLVVDSCVLTAINTRMITPKDFIRAADAVALTPEGRKKFFHAYEQRMDTLVTHPLFGYRVSYRRILEIQTRLLAKQLTGEISNYPVFTTR